MTTTAPATDWYSTEFAVLTATPFPSIVRPTFHTVGHASASCPAIAGERIPAASLADFAEANEHWDGEVDYMAPWPCPTCVPVKGTPATVAFEAPRPAFGTGSPAPRPAVEVDPRAAADLAEAREYAAAYAGRFEFMLDMRVKARRGGTFTPKMVAAILRCKAADAARAATPAAPATPATEADGDEDGRRLNLAPNAFTGACRACSGTVAASAGRREKVDSRWTVLHSTTTECAANATVVPVAPQAPAAPLPDVPAGHYAVETEEGHLAFYSVDRPTEGRWQGRTFVSVQASDEYHPVRGAAVAAVLAKIAVDPRAAMLRYGTEIGRCGHCNRTLTDETSRALGIGPVCRAGMGF